jgi:hypothetical protein
VGKAAVTLPVVSVVKVDLRAHPLVDQLAAAHALDTPSRDRGDGLVTKTLVP